MWRETRRGDAQLTTRRREVAELARRQHGVVSVAQLRALGFTRDAVRRAAESGRLHRVHRGVYAVGHKRIGARGRLWAAVLACGGPERAVLSHQSAASVWDLMPQPSVIDVITLGAARSLPGIRVHRAKIGERAEVEGLPLTSPMRTLLDLATVLTEHRLERVCHRAEQLRLIDVAKMPERGRGVARLRRAIESVERTGPQITRSELEERFLSLVAEAGLPKPRTNARVLGYEVDFLWPDHRLIVETDGVATHFTLAAFENDRARDAKLLSAGYRVIRFTWRQVVEEPRRVVRTLRELLSGAR